MSDAPLISVIVPVHNGGRYLAEAVESVLIQSYRQFELIVVDDGSEDETPRVLAGLSDRLRWVRQDHAGAAAAVNRGVELAGGELLAFLDADDLWTPDKLERQVRSLSLPAGPAIVFGYVRHFHSPDLDDLDRRALSCPAEPTAGISRGTMLIARDDFNRVGPFPAGWRVGEFLDWYARALDAGLETVVLDEVVMLRRLHRTNATLRSADERRDYVRILAGVRRRRRGSARTETA